MQTAIAIGSFSVGHQKPIAIPDCDPDPDADCDRDADSDSDSEKAPLVGLPFRLSDSGADPGPCLW